MKNQTLIFIIVGAIAVYYFIIKRRNGIAPATFHPPGAPSHDSGWGEGSALSNGYDFFEQYQHQAGLGPVDELGGNTYSVDTSNPNEGIATQPRTVAPKGPKGPIPGGRPLGNFANGDGNNGYSPKVGHPTNNVRLLPGKINSGNRQGITSGNYNQ
jgi:hypothetical protein